VIIIWLTETILYLRVHLLEWFVNHYILFPTNNFLLPFGDYNSQINMKGLLINPDIINIKGRRERCGIIGITMPITYTQIEKEVELLL